MNQSAWKAGMSVRLLAEMIIAELIAMSLI
jgi:hypothetical protein